MSRAELMTGDGVTVIDYWESSQAWWTVSLDSHVDPLALEAVQRARAEALIRFAQSRSAFYRKHHGAQLGRANPALRDLPHVRKAELMAAFDDWATDPAVTLAATERFLADTRRVGDAFLGRFAVWTSSGTSGEPGIFVHDGRALAVYDALQAVRFRQLQSPFAALSTLFDRDRYAMVAATGGHFAGNAAVARLRRMNFAFDRRVKMFSIMDPLERLTAGLNIYQPTLLSTYPSSALVLAGEVERGTLRIPLRELWTGGESLSSHDRALLQDVFGCPVRDNYGASEFPPIAFDCHRGAMHLNADWVVLEPVDSNLRPVPPGERSYTALLTNLANFTQPIIRYDLGDSVTIMPERCSCGSPFPVIRVEGRRDDVIRLTAGNGAQIPLLPLAVATVLEEEGRVFRFQLIQTGPATLSLRLDPASREHTVWHRAEAALQRYFSSQGLDHIHIARDPRPPEAEPRSGKCRQVIAQHHMAC